MTSPIEEAIYGLLAQRGPGKSICPSEAARSLDAEHWRRLLPQVRATAVGLARAGRLAITRHGVTVDPNGFKGVYRLRLVDGEPPEKPVSDGVEGERGRP